MAVDPKEEGQEGQAPPPAADAATPAPTTPKAVGDGADGGLPVPATTWE